jgi:integrase
MTRRGPGEGSIRQRRENLFEGRLRNGTERQSVYGPTRAAVRSKLRDLARAADAGLSLAGGRQTVGEYLDRWLVDVAAHRVRPSTLRGYQQHVRLAVNPTIGAIRLDKLTGQDLARLYAGRLDAGKSARTVELTHSVLHSAFKQAVRWDLIARNPADLVSPPRPRRPEIRPLSSAQARTLLAAASGDPLEALYVLALSTGMRQGELLGLTWAAVDVAAGQVEVRATLTRAAGSWALTEPKTARSRRTVRLAGSAIAAVRAHRVRQTEARLLVGSDWGDHDLVFTDAWGEPLDGRHVTSRDFRGLLRRAGLPPIRFHDLRHTAATILLSSGVHPKMVQEMLGHATIALTLDVYSHVTPTMHDEAAATMERVLVG